MPHRFKTCAAVMAMILGTGVGLALAAEAPSNNAQKPADAKTLTRPAQIEPIVGPVKRAVPQAPENKAKPSDKSSDKGKAGSALKVAKEPAKKVVLNSKAAKTTTVKSTKLKKDGKKSIHVTAKKSSNKIAAKKSH